MARGFDSKSVEEQQAEYLAKRSRPEKAAVSTEEAGRERQRESLVLSQKQVKAQLAAATHERHRQMLERALEDLEREIQKLM